MTIKLGNELIEIASLGSGLMSPLTKNPDTGDFMRVSGEDNVRQCILSLLKTRVGERIGHEDMGNPLYGMLFQDPAAVAATGPVLLRELVETYEPRVRDVRVTAQEFPNRVDFELRWVIRSTGQTGNLIYPYYKEPPAGGVSTNG